MTPTTPPSPTRATRRTSRWSSPSRRWPPSPRRRPVSGPSAARSPTPPPWPAATAPIGTITFTLFGPDDATCAGTAAFTSDEDRRRQRRLHLRPVHPHRARHLPLGGVLQRRRQQPAITSPCNAPNESVVVTDRAGATLTTQASSVGGRRRGDRRLRHPVRRHQPHRHHRLHPVRPRRRHLLRHGRVHVHRHGQRRRSVHVRPVHPHRARHLPLGGRLQRRLQQQRGHQPVQRPRRVGGGHQHAGGHLTTQASPSVPVGGQITDTATLAGATNPTGVITFFLYGPDDATCAGAAIFTSDVSVTGNGPYTSGTVHPHRSWHLPLGGRLQLRQQQHRRHPLQRPQRVGGGHAGRSDHPHAHHHRLPGWPQLHRHGHAGRGHEPNRHDHLQPLRPERRHLHGHTALQLDGARSPATGSTRRRRSRPTRPARTGGWRPTAATPTTSGSPPPATTRQRVVRGRRVRRLR